MKSVVILALLITIAPSLSAQSPADITRWEATAARVTITRDDWGIAHVHGPTDADAVFGIRPVYFYPGQLVGHTERVYRPGR